jgi:hypothetical protein
VSKANITYPVPSEARGPISKGTNVTATLADRPRKTISIKVPSFRRKRPTPKAAIARHVTKRVVKRTTRSFGAAVAYGAGFIGMVVGIGALVYLTWIGAAYVTGIVLMALLAPLGYGAVPLGLHFATTFVATFVVYSIAMRHLVVHLSNL